MKITRPFMAFVLTALALAVLWRVPLPQERVLHAAGSPGQEAGRVKGAGPDTTAEDIRGLLIELTEYNACGKLKGTILPLPSGGSPDGGKSSAIGLLRIDSCEARKIAPGLLRIDVSGPGWQWIARKKEQLGATFTLDENVRFTVDISMTGTFDMTYDQTGHILTVWFVPTQPVETSLRVRGNVNVDNDSLWSAIVGTAGTILGLSPESQAKRSIRAQGAEKFTSKLSHGFTVIVNLCTGEHFMRIGTFPAGELPPKAASPGKQICLVNSRGILHSRSLLMAGPYESKKPVIARLDVREGSGVRAVITCEDEARKVADAYVNSQSLPRIKNLAEVQALPGKEASMKAIVPPGCRVVLIMQPLDDLKGPVTFHYRLYGEGAKAKPLVRCGK